MSQSSSLKVNAHKVEPDSGAVLRWRGDLNPAFPFRLAGFVSPERSSLQLKHALESNREDPYLGLSSEAGLLSAIFSQSELFSFSEAVNSFSEVSLFQTLRAETRSGVPFPEFATSLLLFIHRLFLRLKRDGVRDVLFLSREGFFLKRLFDLYIEQVGCDSIRTHYFVVSRRSTYVASLPSADTDDFARILQQYSNTSLGELLTSLNLSDSDLESIRASAEVDLDSRIENLSQSAEFIQLKRSAAFREALARVIAEQRELFKRYLNQFGIERNGRPLALVDVGWKGTIQDNIHHILGQSVPITGYYLGITENVGYHPQSKKIPILFSVPERTQYRQVFNEHRPLFEILLGAPSGSVERYRQVGAGVEPVTNWQPRERELYEKVIAPLQRQIEQSFPRLVRALYCTTIEEEQLFRELAKRHARMVFLPTKRELDFYQSLTHFENFGVFEFANYLKPTTLFSREWLDHLKALRRNFFLTILRDIWPALTLRNMSCGFLRFPYGWGRYLCTFYPLHKRRKLLKGVPFTAPEIPAAHCRVMEAEQALTSQKRLLDERERYLEELRARYARMT